MSDDVDPLRGRRQHNDEDCTGVFRRVFNPGDDLDGAASGLVCPGCGAHRDLEPVADD